MAGEDRRPTDQDAYDRAQRELTEHQVVDVAEDILGHVWMAHLEALRQDSAALVAQAVSSVQAGRRLVHAAQLEGPPGRLARAHDLLERRIRDLGRVLADSRRTLGAVEQELDRLSRAAAARVERRHADVQRLHAAQASAGMPLT